MTATRWRSLDPRSLAVDAEADADAHVVAVVLRTMTCRFSLAGRVVQDGLAPAGMMHVTEPATPGRCIFAGAYDVLHLHVPNGVIAECSRDVADRETAVLRSTPSLTRDPVIERLGRALLGADEVGSALGPLYAESVGMAIVVRLLAAAHGTPGQGRRSVAKLPAWRLRRAFDHVEAHLADRVGLADMAAATGLTRMHFAAQFRAATGLRPHEYLLRRRIERAQELLAHPRMPIVDVALSVGFQSQSHFTSVFTRLIGRSPDAWRRAQDPRP